MDVAALFSEASNVASSPGPVAQNQVKERACFQKVCGCNFCSFMGDTTSNDISLIKVDNKPWGFGGIPTQGHQSTCPASWLKNLQGAGGHPGSCGMPCGCG